MPFEYSHAVQHTAFLIWFERGRDCTAVVEVLTTDPYYRDLAGLAEGDTVPHIQTVRTWEREHFWELKALDAMREVLPHKLRSAGTYMAYKTGDAAVEMGKLLSKPVLTASDKIRKEVAMDILRTGGVADNVAQYAKPVIKQAIDHREIDSMEAAMEAERAALKARNDVD